MKAFCVNEVANDHIGVVKVDNCCDLNKKLQRALESHFDAVVSFDAKKLDYEIIIMTGYLLLPVTVDSTSPFETVIEIKNSWIW